MLDNHPFYNWVPRPIGVLILLFMFVPPIFSGGAYLCNIGEMSGNLGTWTEDIQLASYFTNIGICLFPPFMVRFLQTRRTKQTYLLGFLLLIPLNYFCAITTSVPLLLVACLLIGFVRIIIMLNCTFTIAPYLTGMDTLSMFTMKEVPSTDIQYVLERKRTFLMPVLYFYILLISQASNILTAWFAYNYKWQDAYFVVIGMLFVAILIVLCTMPDEKKKQTYKIEWNKVPEMLLMAVALCCMAYVLVYGKTLDWLYSERILFTTALFLFSCGAFLFFSLYHGAKAYLPLRVFKYRNIWISMLLFLLAMLFNSANVFVSMFAKLSTPINNLQSASLSKWSVLGCFLGLLLSLLLVKRKVRFRVIFCIAFLLMTASNVFFYFQFQTVGLFSNMIIPTILNYTGLLMLYSVVAAFGMKRLPSHLLATFVFLMILMRNAIAPVIGSSVYSNRMNRNQQYYISRLVQNVDEENPIVSTTFQKSKRVGLLSGKSTREAEQFAVTSIKGRIVVQSTILAMKNITGQTIILLLITVCITVLLPYNKKETT